MEAGICSPRFGFVAHGKSFFLMINYLLLGMTTFKVSNSFRSVFDNNDHFVLLTQLWFFGRDRGNSLSWSDPQQAFQEIWKKGALSLSLCKFS